MNSIFQDVGLAREFKGQDGQTETSCTKLCLRLNLRDVKAVPLLKFMILPKKEVRSTCTKLLQGSGIACIARHMYPFKMYIYRKCGVESSCMRNRVELLMSLEEFKSCAVVLASGGVIVGCCGAQSGRCFFLLI